MVRLNLHRTRSLFIFFGMLGLLTSTPAIIAWFHGKASPWTGLAMVVISLALMSIRRYVEIDHDNRLLSLRVGVFHGFRFRRFRFDQAHRVVLQTEWRRSLSRKGSKSTSTVYVLRINDTDGDVLCERQQMWPARLLTERICRELKVDMENRLLLGGSSIRPAAELDMPLFERWRRAGIHQQAPQLPAGTSLQIEHGENFSEMSYPVKPARRLLTGIIGIAVLAGLYALHRYTDFPGPVLLLFASGTTFLFGSYIAQHTGRNRVRFTAERVEFHRGLFSRRAISLSAIEEFFTTNFELVLMSDHDHLLIELPDELADLPVLEQFVERQIAQRQSTLASVPA